MPYHAGVLLIDRMFDWLEPSPTRITILGVCGMLNSSTQHKARLQFTWLSYMLIKKVNSWQVRIAAAFYLLSKMKKWFNLAPILWMAAQFWRQYLQCHCFVHKRCIVKSPKKTWSGQIFLQIKQTVFADCVLLLKRVLEPSTLSQHRTLYSCRIRTASCLSTVLHSCQNSEKQRSEITVYTHQTDILPRSNILLV